MSSQLPVLLFLVPFVMAVAMPIVCAKRRSWCSPLTIGAVSVMVILAIMNLRVVLSEGSIEYARQAAMEAGIDNVEFRVE